jgi:two-component system NarL family sensor kinase
MHKDSLPEDIKNLILALAVIFICLGIFIILFVILFNKRKNRMLREKQEIQSRFQQELLQTQIEIQEQTLKTISQEIHDNVGQILSLAKLNLNTFPFTNDEQQTKINDTKQLVSKAIIDLRNLSRSMYGDQLNELGLNDAIANELSIIRNTGQFETQLNIEGEKFKLSLQHELVIFRMLQEAVNNIIKHAKAKNIYVTLQYNNPAFEISVTDDGKGFDPDSINNSKNGMGLKSMKNRAALIGGNFEIDSNNGKGSTLSLNIPDAKTKTL